MALAAEMETCLDAAAACRAALLVDLEDGLVLASRGLSAAGGEAAEAMAAAACELLGKARPAALRSAGRDYDHAVIAASDGLHIFLRLDGAPNRALCLDFPPEADPEAALAFARQRRQAVGAAGLW